MQTLPKLTLLAALCVPFATFADSDNQQCSDTQSQFELALIMAQQFQSRLACYTVIYNGVGDVVKCIKPVKGGAS